MSGGLRQQTVQPLTTAVQTKLAEERASAFQSRFVQSPAQRSNSVLAEERFPPELECRHTSVPGNIECTLIRLDLCLM